MVESTTDHVDHEKTRDDDEEDGTARETLVVIIIIIASILLAGASIGGLHENSIETVGFRGDGEGSSTARGDAGYRDVGVSVDSAAATE